MSTQKDIVIHNDDTTAFEYVLFVLNNVFGIDKKQGARIAQQVDKDGSYLVFTGDEAEVLQKLEQIQDYNEASNNHLRVTCENTGMYQAPVEKAHGAVTTQGGSLTLQFKNYIPDPASGLLNAMVHAGNLGFTALEQKELFQQLSQGREVILKDFQSDPKGQAKAHMLQEVVTSSIGLGDNDDQSDFEPEEIENIVFAVREAGYTLLGPHALMSENDMAQQVVAQGMRAMASEVSNAYEEDILKEYGSLENFLKTASPQEVDEYNDIQARLEGIENKWGKPKGMGKS